MSDTQIALNDSAYPPLTLDLCSATQTVNGQTVKINVGVVDATRLTGLDNGQVAQVFADVHADMP